MNRQEVHSIREELLELCSMAEELPDPWIKLLCEYNLYILRNDNFMATDVLEKTYPGNVRLYGLILNNPNINSFMLGISPHWRY